MKRFLTIILMTIFVLVTVIGCTDIQNPPPTQPPQMMENGQPPEAEAKREDVLGADKRVVMAFYTDGEGEIPSSKESMLKNAKIIDEISFFWYSFDGKGNVVPTGEVNLSLKDAAQKNKAKAYAVVHNLTKDGFDANLAHKVLANPTARNNLVQSLVKLTTKDGWDGIAVDIEKTPPGDRDNYSAFVNDLHKALKAKDKILNVSIPAKFVDYPSDLWSGAYDYAAIGKGADQVVLMTYDEHGTGTTHGPIASHDWVDRVINYAVEQIPKEKIVMGLPVYSFDWGTDKPTKPAYLTYNQSLEQAKKHGVEVFYDGAEQVPHYHYTASGIRHEVYLENSKSLGKKLEYAKGHELHGVAIWRLGMEDPSLWDKVLKTYGTNQNKK